MLIVVDVGNTGAKAAAYSGAELRGFARFLPSEIDTPERLVDLLEVRSEDVESVVVVSVSEPGLAAFLSGPGQGAVVLGRDVEILVENRYLDPAEVGADRLANCAAAHEACGGPAVAVDLGTAVTVDAVSADGAFLGGAIGPGLPSLTTGLCRAAPGLPEWHQEEPEGGLPRSTRQAVSWGIVHGFAGLVDRLVEDVRRSVPEAAPILLTGGDGVFMAGRLACRPRIVAHLTLDGVRILYDRARRA